MHDGSRQGKKWSTLLAIKLAHPSRGGEVPTTVAVVVVVVVVVLTLTHNSMQSVVAGPAPITLEWKKYLN